LGENLGGVTYEFTLQIFFDNFCSSFGILF
jgi:hypothetical protein